MLSELIQVMHVDCAETEAANSELRGSLALAVKDMEESCNSPGRPSSQALFIV